MKKKSQALAPKHRSAKFWPVMGFAALAGMRSMSAPAFLSHYLSRQPHTGLAGSSLRFLQKPVTAQILKALAAGEMVVDKLPTTPNRTAPPVLLGRLLAGSLVGAAWYKSRHGSALSGGVLGGLAAVAATFVSFALRTGISQQTDTPIALVGVGEDALVVGSGAALLRGVRPAHGEWRPL
ncbi:DUF4126 family protein [Microvirga sp. STS02]|uniref:DUF4126 family protein n=1 Tax=Hymenobacter negativus TaxID=2795026 RepID=UPI0018DE1272|nr:MULTISPECIES: DUF4126 family protein [Bacteria]MBH8568484.1 DUF4126 family protein [Hymenobacter negativus]MBR7208218.1 DUF4126 family protein [Microvirga sp. STS02]